MTDSLYVKTASGILPIAIEGTGGGTVSRTVFTSKSRTGALGVGTEWNVPTYTKGNNSLSVFINGVLCVNGEEYTEVTATSVSFTSEIPADYELTAAVIGGSGAGTRLVSVSESRESEIVAGADYDVPAHTVGENRIAVFLNGLQYSDFIETSSTTISFDNNIPADMQIIVQVEA